MAIAGTACSSPTEGPAPEVSEIGQAVGDACGAPSICLARPACTSWDLNSVGDGLGYTAASSYEASEYQNINCDDRSGCNGDAPTMCADDASARRTELLAARPGISWPALVGFTVSFDIVDVGYATYGCGPYDQYCASSYDFYCLRHVNNFPTPINAVRDWCPCTQSLPVARSVLAAGNAHSCALLSGGVQCWGANGNGQLGNGGIVDSAQRVSVAGLSSGVLAVAAGSLHGCAIVNGAAKCWGYNLHGQLGDGAVVERHAPVAVTGLDVGVQAISGGDQHTCAIVAGAARCWGANANGQLGNASIVDSHVPAQVSGATTGVQSIAAGGSHSCAVVGGAVKCWGLNLNGQLGNNATAESHSPVQAIATGATAVAAGFLHTCALVNGGVQCWGANESGQLGNGSTADSHVPVQVVGLTTSVKSITAGRKHTCAQLTTGAIKCWGDNSTGQLGIGSLAASAVPVAVTGLPGSAQEVVNGSQHSCASVNGGVLCWGLNGNGQLATDTTFQSTVPLAVAGLTTCAPTP